MSNRSNQKVEKNTAKIRATMRATDRESPVWIFMCGLHETGPPLCKKESQILAEKNAYGTHAHLEFERREEKCSGPKVDTHQNGLCLREANYISASSLTSDVRVICPHKTRSAAAAVGFRSPLSLIPTGESGGSGDLRLSSSLSSIREVQEQRDLGDKPEKPISSDSSSEDDSDEEKNEKPGTEVDQQSILVLMTNTADPTAPPMETFIEDHEDYDGQRCSDTTARISRPGFTGPNSQMVIGKVKDFVVPRKEKPAGEDRDEQDPMENNSVRTNTMSLTEVEGTNFLSLPLFYVPTASPALPTSLTGDSSDEPREIAANQKAAATAVADPQPRPADFTAQYLGFIFLLKGTDTAVKVDKNVTAADALANYRVIEPHYGCYRVFQAKNGYLCPAGEIL
ncbi:hypothetical protein R3P38DRAFT_2793479 [Favolaschia claudopus]|uniref:Uncharacterized protein n=1 Tax=Favolaschia claudopus TaxID=2862362 RepID=A0AAW0AC91_9AGAR